MESTVSYLDDTTSKLSIDDTGRAKLLFSVDDLMLDMAVNLGIVTVRELTSSGLIDDRGRGDVGCGEGKVTLVSLIVGERLLRIILSRGVEGRNSKDDSLVLSSSSTSSVRGDIFCFLENGGGNRESLPAHGLGGEGNIRCFSSCLNGSLTRGEYASYLAGVSGTRLGGVRGTGDGVGDL